MKQLGWRLLAAVFVALGLVGYFLSDQILRVEAACVASHDHAGPGHRPLPAADAAAYADSVVRFLDWHGRADE